MATIRAIPVEQNLDWLVWRANGNKKERVDMDMHNITMSNTQNIQNLTAIIKIVLRIF